MLVANLTHVTYLEHSHLTSRNEWMLGRNRAWMLCLFFTACLRLTVALEETDTSSFQGRTVTAIRYDPEPQPIDPHDLASCQLVEVGKPLDLSQVAATIDRLYATGLYKDIRVYGTQEADGVSIRFETNSANFIGHVEIRGTVKDPPNRSVLLGAAGLELGQPFDSATVENARSAVEHELRLNGLFQAALGVTTIEDPVTHQVTIGFIVNSGKRARYEMPIFNGDTKLPVTTLLNATGWRIRVIHRWRYMTKALNDGAVNGIEKKYAKQDRLMASVQLTSVDSDDSGRRARPHLEIDAGPKIEIRALEAKISKSKLRRYVPVFEEGSIDNDLLTEGARNLRDYFQSRGYPDADVTFKRQPTENDKQIINYYISTGC